MTSRQSMLVPPNVQDRSEAPEIGVNQDDVRLPYTQPPPSNSKLVKYPPQRSEREVPPIPHGIHLNHDPEQALHMPLNSSGSSITLSKPKSDQDPVDGKTSKLPKLHHYSTVVRWVLFIVPILLVIWIPGVLSLTMFPRATIWSVRLFFWSIWLSIVWAGWWAALAMAYILPGIIKATVGVIALSTRRYVDRIQALYRYIAFFAWTIVIWVSFNPLITLREVNPGDKSTTALSIVARLLFALLLCGAVLLFEKFSIQWIAWKFHERSYAERIADQKHAVQALATLYRHSTSISRRPQAAHLEDMKGEFHGDTNHLFRDIRLGFRSATTITATAFGNVASDLQPNSPRAVIKTALESAKRTRLLARRIFYSFAVKEREFIFVEDIESLFPTRDEADRAYALFDKDSNGDISLEEMEMACLNFHREQISIEHSMQDLDSAVGKLDDILMSIYVIIVILIIAVALEAQLITVVTGAGALILGLSWLIGGSLTEVLTSIIFLLVKHPFDVGDRVILNKEIYTVKEINLLSTVFLDSTSSIVQAPNNQLNTLFIQNIRRSPGTSESIVFDVAYSTTFEDLEHLREKMLEFVTGERRDFLPVFDVTVKEFPDQSKMTLSADIKYKSNGQHAAVKAKRRNKWMCALKTALAEVKIYGPGGNPNGPPTVSRYTRVPWSTLHADDQQVGKRGPDPDEVLGTRTSRQWHLNDEIGTILESKDEEDADGESSDDLHVPPIPANSR